jgi:hypothetical protein
MNNRDRHLAPAWLHEMGGGCVICAEMEASKSMPYRQPWQELLGCELYCQL